MHFYQTVQMCFVWKLNTQTQWRIKQSFIARLHQRSDDS